jgi:hypothetical protein
MQTILILLRIPCHPERPLSPMDRDHGVKWVLLHQITEHLV